MDARSCLLESGVLAQIAIVGLEYVGVTVAACAARGGISRRARDYSSADGVIACRVQKTKSVGAGSTPIERNRAAICPR